MLLMVLSKVINGHVNLLPPAIAAQLPNTSFSQQIFQLQ